MKKLLPIIILIILIFNSNIAYAIPDNQYTVNNTFFVNNIEIDNISENNQDKTNFWWMSILVPGLGQILMGDFWRGFIYSISTLFFIIIVIGLYFLRGPESEYRTIIYSERNNLLQIIINSNFVKIFILHLLNIYDSYSFNLETQNEKLYINKNGLSYNIINF